MQLEVGGIYNGKVTGITKFGAFVALEGGQTGMVHISEVASTFVNEIREFVTEGQEVKVKLLGINEEGKISLSIKKAAEPSRPQRKPDSFSKTSGGNQSRQRRSPAQPSPARPGDFQWQAKSNESNSFEDMMSKFKQTSEEKISDLKRTTETKRGYSRRGQQK